MRSLRFSAPLVGVAALLLVAGCSSTPSTGTTGEKAPSMDDVKASTSATTAAESETASNDGVYKFGETAKFDGLSIGVSAPAAFTPGEYAYTGDNPTPNNVKVTITIQNTGSKPYDPVLTSATMSSGQQEATAVVDTESKIGVPPTTKVLPGKAVSYDVGFNVADPNDLQLDVTGGFEYDTVTFTK
ncbi:hypothetical protein [Curtobacterium sp. MCSS17_007]|uniref:hypothetical protein n=1 Tax=Curtobacterium sp. MCSS17_007 TaxID=2175646 RepID=UPI000DAA128A|nr:hypothetical protein [Curtobacterium sp. MCSS17_007]WIE76544.1 hypothetical protein DEJ22_004570 [Curtobacterium sp. MCSS17_007]